MAAIVPTGLGLAPAAFAQQSDDAVARAVVQPLPSREVQRLNEALRRLARNSRDLTALTDAGNASLDLGDLQAALGFFGRAQDLAPNNPSVKMGMAAVYLRSERPLEALRLFAEAEQAGANFNAVAAERGLALDLVGNNQQAQANYKIALDRGAGAEVARRLAISHAIAGNKEDFEIILQPFVAKRDFAAFRARAFGLAILGETGEANAIADAVMPRDLASRLAPYLDYMPRLTKAQQAAAANLGVFPKAAQIGRDDPRIAQYARSGGTAGVDARLAPSGAPLGRASTDSRRRRPDRTGAGNPVTRKPERVAAVKPAPTSAPSAPIELPPVAASKPAPKPVQQIAVAVPPPSPKRPKPEPAPQAAPASTLSVATFADATGVSSPKPNVTNQAEQVSEKKLAAAIVTTPAASSFDLAASSGSTNDALKTAQANDVVPTAQANTVATPIVQVAPSPRAKVADAFADLASKGRTSITAPQGAVDLSKISVRREAKPESEKTESKEQHPKRFWVQIATVKDSKALKPEYRRLSRKAGDVLKEYSGFATEWGETNRLLAGPVSTSKQAQQVIAALKEQGVDSFLHTSAKGQIITKIQ